MISLNKAISILSIAVVSSISTLSSAHEIPHGKFNTELNHLREGRGNNNALEASREDAAYAVSDVVAKEDDDDEILIYLRNEIDGSLTFESREFTTNGGIGYEQGLLSGNKIIVAGECIIAVNSQSNDISTFRMKSTNEMEHKGKFPTSGAFPVSVASREGLVYVLNGGGDGSIQGYTLTQSDCGLTSLGDAMALPNSNTIPSQIGFTTQGNLLVTMTADGGLLDSVLTSGVPGSDESLTEETLFTGGPLILLLVTMGLVTKFIVNL
mmetsp:Transcript_31726/g.68520  ORF Transcript_31726/g.68520 Transcript_31726/m.68520 type:complete len:267 (+) Transcript_31726:146-946(+)